MVRLWQRLGEIFGNQFGLNFGAVGGSTFYTWKEGLADYSEMQLKHGLEQCRLWDSSFVPHLGQFAKMCLSKRSNGPNFTQERLERGAEPLLEKLKRNAITPIAKAELARIEAIQQGEHVETKRESWNKLNLAKTHGAAPAHWE